MDLNSQTAYVSDNEPAWKDGQDGRIYKVNGSSRMIKVATALTIAFVIVLAAQMVLGQGDSDPAHSGGTVKKNSIGMELVKIPGSRSYKMGSPASEDLRDADEGPVRNVSISNDLWMGKYEVTQAEWEKVMGSNPSGFRDCARCPVENVSWDDAQEFIKKLNARNDGFSYRLPSEAEWEFAARAGSSTPFSIGGKMSPADANFDSRYPYGGADKGQYIVKTEPVGSYKPNAFGLYDMHGNVWEWVEDIYVRAGYAGMPADGSANSSNGDPNKRVRRGGGWDSWGKALRSANRGWKNPRDRNKNGGFRIVAIEK